MTERKPLAKTPPFPVHLNVRISSSTYSHNPSTSHASPGLAGQPTSQRAEGTRYRVRIGSSTAFDPPRLAWTPSNTPEPPRAPPRARLGTRTPARSDLHQLLLHQGGSPPPTGSGRPRLPRSRPSSSHQLTSPQPRTTIRRSPLTHHARPVTNTVLALFPRIFLWFRAAWAIFQCLFISFIRARFVRRTQEATSINHSLCDHGPPQPVEELSCNDHGQRRHSLSAVTTRRVLETDQKMELTCTLISSKPNFPTQQSSFDSIKEEGLEMTIHIASGAPIEVDVDYAGPRRPPFPKSTSPWSPSSVLSSPSPLPLPLHFPKKSPLIDHNWRPHTRIPTFSEPSRSGHRPRRRRRLLSTSSDDSDSHDSRVRSLRRRPVRRQEVLGSSIVPGSDADESEKEAEVVTVKRKLNRRGPKTTGVPSRLGQLALPSRLAIMVGLGWSLWKSLATLISTISDW